MGIKHRIAYATFVAVSLVGGLTGCSSGSPTPAAAPTRTVTVTAPPVTTTVKVPGPASTTVHVTRTVEAPAPSPAAAIEEGVWTVGSDIAPGTYRTIDVVTSDCYWKISKSGSNGSDIIENDTPTGGHPVVTLRKGEDFETQGCGSWARR